MQAQESYMAATTELRKELVNKGIQVYLDTTGLRPEFEALGLTKEEKYLVFDIVGTIRQERNRVENTNHFLTKFNELVVGNERYLTSKDYREIERQAKAYAKDMATKIKQGVHISANDYLVK